jgi:hypothetical protein
VNAQMMNSSLYFATISIIQFLLAVTFFIVPFVALRYGDKAQEAAERYVSEQGVDSRLLSKNGFRVAESRIEILFPLAIAVVFTTLGLLNLLSHDLGKTASFVVHIIFFFAGGFITASQVFVIQFTENLLSKSSDHDLRRVDAKALIGEVNAIFPTWLRAIIVTRFILSTAGSVVIVLMLILDR